MTATESPQMANRKMKLKQSRVLFFRLLVPNVLKGWTAAILQHTVYPLRFYFGQLKKSTAPTPPPPPPQLKDRSVY